MSAGNLVDPKYFVLIFIIVVIVTLVPRVYRKLRPVKIRNI